MKTFGKVSIGVHGKELPKFGSEATTKEWWKHKEGYIEMPLYKSAKHFSQDKKFWAKNDEMYLADTKTEEGPQDYFKQTHVKSEKKNEVC
jgi:hypothetical protein